MESTEYTFTFADILSRRGDFYRDIRSVGNVEGYILTCRCINEENDYGIAVRLWMPGPVGKTYAIMTVIAFFDPGYISDIIIIPEYKIAFYYHWGRDHFRTDKIMSIIDVIYYKKSTNITLYEWNFLSIAAAVCAVYEYRGRLRFDGFNKVCEPPDDLYFNEEWD